MKIFDSDKFGWAVVVIAIFFFTAQVLRAVANGLWG
jgi:hypothetical protein